MSYKVWTLVVEPQDVGTGANNKYEGRTPEVKADMQHADMVVLLAPGKEPVVVKRPQPRVKPDAAVNTERFSALDTTVRPPPKVVPKAIRDLAEETVATTPAVASAPARRYEYIGGTSKKFWEIRIDGTRYVARWGRIGTDGSVTIKNFGSTDEAQREADKMVASKLAKGYRKV